MDSVLTLCVWIQRSPLLDECIRNTLLISKVTVICGILSKFFGGKWRRFGLFKNLWVGGI